MRKYGSERTHFKQQQQQIKTRRKTTIHLKNVDVPAEVPPIKFGAPAELDEKTKAEYYKLLDEALNKTE